MGSEGIAIFQNARQIADKEERGGGERVDGGGLLGFVNRTKIAGRRRKNSSQTRRGLRVALIEPRTCVQREKNRLLEEYVRREPPFLFGAGLEFGSEVLRWRQIEGLFGDWLRGLLARSWLVPF